MTLQQKFRTLSLALIALTVQAARPQHSVQAQSLYDYIRRYEIVLGGIYCESDLYDLYNGKPIPTTTLHTVAGGINVGLGLYVPIVELGKGLSAGINTDVEMFVGSAPYDPDFPAVYENLNQSDGWARLAVPLFAALKYGTDATLRPTTEIGVGTGIGYRPVLNLGAEYSYGSVVVMGEFSLVVGEMLVKLRGTAPLTAGSPLPGTDIRTYEFSMLLLPGG